MVVVELAAGGARSECVTRDPAVAEGLDQVLAGDLPAGPGVGWNAGVVREVVHVHRAVAVQVEPAVSGGRVRVAGRVLRERELARVQVDLCAQARAIPLDAGVEDRDDHVRAAPRELPGAGRVVTGDLVARRRRAPSLPDAVRSVVVDGAWREHGREPEEVEALVVEVRLRGLVAARLGVVVVGVVRLVEPLDVRVRELLRGVVRGGVLEVAGQRDGDPGRQQGCERSHDRTDRSASTPCESPVTPLGHDPLTRHRWRRAIVPVGARAPSRL